MQFKCLASVAKLNSCYSSLWKPLKYLKTASMPPLDPHLSRPDISSAFPHTACIPMLYHLLSLTARTSSFSASFFKCGAQTYTQCSSWDLSSTKQSDAITSLGLVCYSWQQGCQRHGLWVRSSPQRPSIQPLMLPVVLELTHSELMCLHPRVASMGATVPEQAMLLWSRQCMQCSPGAVGLGGAVPEQLAQALWCAQHPGQLLWDACWIWHAGLTCGRNPASHYSSSPCG